MQNLINEFERIRGDAKMSYEEKNKKVAAAFIAANDKLSPEELGTVIDMMSESEIKMTKVATITEKEKIESPEVALVSVLHPDRMFNTRLMTNSLIGALFAFAREDGFPDDVDYDATTAAECDAALGMLKEFIDTQCMKKIRSEPIVISTTRFGEKRVDGEETTYYVTDDIRVPEGTFKSYAAYLDHVKNPDYKAVEAAHVAKMRQLYIETGQYLDAENFITRHSGETLEVMLEAYLEEAKIHNMDNPYDGPNKLHQPKSNLCIMSMSRFMSVTDPSIEKFNEWIRNLDQTISRELIWNPTYENMYSAHKHVAQLIDQSRVSREQIRDQNIREKLIKQSDVAMALMRRYFVTGFLKKYFEYDINNEVQRMNRKRSLDENTAITLSKTCTDYRNTFLSLGSYAHSVLSHDAQMKLYEYLRPVVCSSIAPKFGPLNEAITRVVTMRKIAYDANSIGVSVDIDMSPAMTVLDKVLHEFIESAKSSMVLTLEENRRQYYIISNSTSDLRDKTKYRTDLYALDSATKNALEQLSKFDYSGFMNDLRMAELRAVPGAIYKNIPEMPANYIDQIIPSFEQYARFNLYFERNYEPLVNLTQLSFAACREKHNAIKILGTFPNAEAATSHLDIAGITSNSDIYAIPMGSFVNIDPMEKNRNKITYDSKEMDVLKEIEKAQIETKRAANSLMTERIANKHVAASIANDDIAEFEKLPEEAKNSWRAKMRENGHSEDQLNKYPELVRKLYEQRTSRPAHVRTAENMRTFGNDVDAVLLADEDREKIQVPIINLRDGGRMTLVTSENIDQAETKYAVQ